MKTKHFKRVKTFPQILHKLALYDIWDNVVVTTDIEMSLPLGCSGLDTEYALKVEVAYTDCDGEPSELGFLYSTNNWNKLIEMEEKARKIIPEIYA